MAKELSEKQKRFCEEYVIDLNGTQAAIRAGYSEKTANEQAARLLANVSIRDYLKDKQKTISDELKIDAKWVINRFKEISDRCMTAEPVTVPDGNGGRIETGEYTFDSSGANKATEMIGKHLGVFEKDNQQQATIANITHNIIIENPNNGNADKAD